MTKCISYKGVNGLLFNDSPEKAIEIFGEPTKKEDTSDGIELHYEHYIIRFDNNKMFREFTLLPTTPYIINNIKGNWTYLGIQSFIKLDNNPQEYVGFIILFELGISFVGFHDYPDNNLSEKAIHIFRKHDWDDFTATEDFKI